MDVSLAVRTAKTYVSEVFKEEQIANLGLEEVEHDELTWNITIGFSRPWNLTRNALNNLVRTEVPDRSYKIVVINDSDGRVLSMKDRGSSK